MNSNAFRYHLLGSTSVVTWFGFSYFTTIYVEMDSYEIYTHLSVGIFTFDLHQFKMLTVKVTHISIVNVIEMVTNRAKIIAYY